MISKLLTISFPCRTLYYSPNIITILIMMKWEEHADHIKDQRNPYKIVIGKPDGKGPIGIPWRRRCDSTKLYLKEIACESME